MKQILLILILATASNTIAAELPQTTATPPLHGNNGSSSLQKPPGQRYHLTVTTSDRKATLK